MATRSSPTRGSTYVTNVSEGQTHCGPIGTLTAPGLSST